jgi:hypothetical protein
MLKRNPKRYPALFISGLLAVAAAVVDGVVAVSEPWRTVALVVLVGASGAGIHTQVAPAVRRRGKLR